MMSQTPYIMGKSETPGVEMEKLASIKAILRIRRGIPVPSDIPKQQAFSMLTTGLDSFVLPHSFLGPGNVDFSYNSGTSMTEP